MTVAYTAFFFFLVFKSSHNCLKILIGKQKTVCWLFGERVNGQSIFYLKKKKDERLYLQLIR